MDREVVALIGAHHTGLRVRTELVPGAGQVLVTRRARLTYT